MRVLDTPEDLAQFAQFYDLRPDWHEPDKQGITARMVGVGLDNAFGAGFNIDFAPSGEPYRVDDDMACEMQVVLVLKQYNEPVAVVNLANLFAWATIHGRNTILEKS